MVTHPPLSRFATIVGRSAIDTAGCYTRRMAMELIVLAHDLKNSSPSKPPKMAAMDGVSF